MSFTDGPVDTELEPFDLATGEVVQAEPDPEPEPEAETSPEPEPDESTSPDGDEYEDVDQDFLSQTFRVKVDGEEVEVTLDEALKGYQRQADYTRKTQELADVRRQAEALESLEASLVEDFDGTVARLRAALGLPQVAPATRGDEDVFDLDLGEPGPDEALSREVQELRAWRQQQEALAQQAQVERQLDSLVAQYGDEDVTAEAILRTATENRILDLGAAAKLTATLAKEAREAEATRQRIVQRKRVASKVQQGSGAASTSVQTGGKERPDIREAFLSALGQ